MTIDDIKTNGFTRRRLFDTLIAVKFGLEGFPHVFELILYKRTKQLFSKWKSQDMLQYELGKSMSNLFFRENPFIKMLREKANAIDGGTFLQEPLIYDR